MAPAHTLRVISWFVIPVATFVAACTGSIETFPGAESSDDSDDGAGAGGSGGSGGRGGGPVDACRTSDVGPTPLRRLTRAQYDNTVAALLGDASAPARSFAPDETLLGFSAGLSVSPLLIDQMTAAAEKLAANAVTNLPRLLGCDPKTGEDACAHRFIDSFGRRAFRRPLADDERTDMRALYAANKASAGFSKAIELVTQAFLASPAFLYRIEIGKATSRPGIVELDGWEIASRLSYLLWNSMPDDALFDAAAAGRLDTPAGIAAEVDRMLADPKAKAVVESFAEQWLELERLSLIGKDSKLFPGFDDKLRKAMHDETIAFVDSVVLEGDARLSTLLGASWSMVPGPLATLYGMAAATDPAPVRKELPAAERHGLLTHASVLAINAKSNQSSPVHRGVFVRERLLCQPLPSPPANLMVQAPDPAPGLTTRERFAEHSTNDSCSGCHVLIDPVGFGFEHYDAIGRYRTTDGTAPVDARGELVDTVDIDGTFDGVGELSDKLQGSREVAACMVGKWFVYAFGRSHTNELDSCSVAKLGEVFAKEGGDLRAVLRAIPTTDAFRFTRVALSGGGL